MRSHPSNLHLPAPRAGALALAAALAFAGTPAAHAADIEKLRLRNDLGIVEAKSGHLEDALRQFALVLAEAPSEPAALNNTANVYFLDGDTDRARELYQRAIAAAPKEGGVHLNLGLLLHSLGATDQALVHVREGLLLVGDLQHAYFLLGLSSQPEPTPQTADPAGVASAPPGAEGTPATSAAPAGRASDEAGLRSVEIEALLARAIEKVPHADSTAAKVAVEGRMASRPAGSKAAQVETSPQRLYWMPVGAKP